MSMRGAGTVGRDAPPVAFGAFCKDIGASRLGRGASGEHDGALTPRETWKTDVMKKNESLGTILTIVAVIEAIYALLGLFTPPGMVHTVTGWVLTPDGQWVTKLMGGALASQAWVAWMMRREPHLGVVKALAFYQIVSATIDWSMWLLLADQGIFSNTAARVGVIASIGLHYALGVSLLLALRSRSRALGSSTPGAALGERVAGAAA